MKRCDLSGNVITKIPPKFAVKFSLITELNLSHNQMSKLPEELSELQALERLDISHNTFIALPPVTCRIPQLKHLLANNNSIVDVDVEILRHAPVLEFIDLKANPLTARMHDLLGSLTRIRIELTPRPSGGMGRPYHLKRLFSSRKTIKSAEKALNAPLARTLAFVVHVSRPRSSKSSRSR